MSRQRKERGVISTWWSVSEVADHLGLSEEATRDIIVNGPLQGSYIGGELRVYDPGLLKFLGSK